MKQKSIMAIKNPQAREMYKKNAFLNENYPSEKSIFFFCKKISLMAIQGLGIRILN